MLSRAELDSGGLGGYPTPCVNILVLHGPNLNLLGEREPSVYGKTTLKELDALIKKRAGRRAKIRIFQSNHEGALIDLIHKHRKWAAGLVFNPGAYTHYSYALRDAVQGSRIPTIEVHLSDIHKREEFRRVSVIAPVCLAQITGKGVDSYLEALERLIEGNHVS
jgi:3-dehydroquinate dehydratase-2